MTDRKGHPRARRRPPRAAPAAAGTNLWLSPPASDDQAARDVTAPRLAQIPLELVAASVQGLESLAQALARIGRELVPVDAVELVLCDEPGLGGAPASLVAIDARSGIDTSWWVGVRFQVPSEHCAALLEHPAIEVPGGTALDDTQAMLKAHGIQGALMVALTRDATLLGYIKFNHFAAGRGFSAEQRALARSLAAQGALAVAGLRAEARLAAAESAKLLFVSTMSHELRTPLHVILGYAEMIADLGPEAAAAAEHVRHASRELLDLVESTLDVNRLQAGADDLQIEAVDLGALWTELAGELGALRRRPDVALRFSPPPRGTMQTDRRKLRIIVKNIVGNALKFTARGRIDVELRIRRGRWMLAVRDTGIGIAPEDLSRIFEMFGQARPDPSAPRPGGVGLGLYIVRQLCDQLGGEISVETAPGAGSTFRVELPINSARRGQHGDTPHAARPTGRKRARPTRQIAAPAPSRKAGSATRSRRARVRRRES